MKKRRCVRAKPSHTRIKRLLLELVGSVVATVDKDLGVVGDINALGCQQIGGHDLDAVVVGLCVIHINGLALQSLINHLGGLSSQQTSVLENGVFLLASDDRL